jgi:hypothetical protein
VTCASGEILNHVKENITRKLTTLFGIVTVTRIRYNQRRQSSQFPLDASLNLAEEQYSAVVRDRVAREAIRGSYDDVVETIKHTTGCYVPKRQCLNLVQDSAQDFESFYQQSQFWKPEVTTDIMVITSDEKGIIMLPDNLRECTKKAAKNNKKLNSRLSQGEKKDRKRMAQVMSVYTVLPHSRSPGSVMKINDAENDNVREFRAPARNKRV